MECFSIDDNKSARFSLRDLLIVLSLVILVFCVYFTGLGNLEFFRHTEADRVLIAWGMVESGNYVIPSILGAEIFTKPPLFYWLVAGAIMLLDSVQECVVRLPNVIFASLLVMVQYLTLRKVGFNYFFSAVGALFLASCGQFFLLTGTAEIDLVFVFFCSVSLYLMFFALNKPSLKILIFSYIFSALAFLTKGYPIIGLVGGITLAYWISSRIFKRESLKGKASNLEFLEVHPISFGKFVVWNLCGACVFLGLIGIWIYFVLNHEYGWNYLSEYVNGEFNKRIVSNGREESVFFYLPAALINTAPWSIFLVLGLGSFLLNKFSHFSRHKTVTNITTTQTQANQEAPVATLPDRNYFQSDICREFFIFNLVGLVMGIILLSIPAGKAERYFAPLLGVTSNLILFGVWQLFYRKPTLISNKKKIFSILAIIFILVLARGVMVYPIAKYRNQQWTVKPFISLMQRSLPAEAPIYFEMGTVERWVAYYLKRDGRKVFILTSQLVEERKNHDGDSYVIVSFNAWQKLSSKFNQNGIEYKEVASNVHQLSGKNSSRRAVVLIKLNNADLDQLPSKQYIEWI
ncbi:MAG: glycosyltransferase family 39 protein [Deltaproteobacteria bacterium]|jgi:4-amino-4-deoxy-L-arabinose transferase-like glycosyltransferase|nr:glycosyltransferase family 39 protein [Deltaproteobacteria bacterium]